MFQHQIEIMLDDARARILHDKISDSKLSKLRRKGEMREVKVTMPGRVLILNTPFMCFLVFK